VVTKNKKTSFNQKNGKLRFFTVVILLVLVMTGLEISNTTHIFHKKSAAVSSDPSSKAITQLPAQPAANNGEKKISSSSMYNDGASTDNDGVVKTAGSSPDTWIKSESGVITVKHPASNTIIASGVELSGAATTDRVQYRLTDDQVGVISQGSISVTNGSFSANLTFHPQASKGRLDIFTTDNTGNELNEVQLLVKF
jgi:zona occludens toxin (predicted ATPase)